MDAEPGRQKTCPICGAALRCGPGTASKGSGCWCETLPALKSVAGRDCLCPTCLSVAVTRQEDSRES
jgi:hypothetical protein